MTKKMQFLCRRAAQYILIFTIRPYVIRELPGWGRVYALVGNWRRNWLWLEAPIKIVRGKAHGYLMRLDLSNWSDRSTFFLGRWYDLHTQLLISDLINPGDTVVDIGANRGMFALVASRLVGPRGKVLCFEPNPGCAKLLDHEIAANRIENTVVYRVGLGSQQEERMLAVPFINSGEGTFGKSGYGADLTYHVRCQIQKGDDMLTTEQPSLLKIDVEGFECHVIAGLADTVRREHPIIVTEVNPTLLSRCGSSIAELTTLMERFGYRGFRIDLSKVHGRYTWKLKPYKTQDHASDAVWLHPTSMRRHAKVLIRHDCQQ